MKKALISGVAGQDGSYLAELLLSYGYEVHGIIRRNSVPENQSSRLRKIESHIKTYYADLNDHASIFQLINKISPDELYNLAAQSHVRISFDLPQLTLETNTLGLLNILESVKQINPNCKLYQASSSEMFGNQIDPDGFQRETTPMKPISPYGIAKLASFNLVKSYRSAYGLFYANGILFNHESPRRASNFVTNKVIKSAVEIYLGKKEKLELGNIDAMRDWGHSKDYVRAMQIILNLDNPDDYCVSTGITKSVRELCDFTFNYLNLNYEDYIVFNESYTRPNELNALKGDSSKFRQISGWAPEISFEEMLIEMIENWINYFNENKDFF